MKFSFPHREIEIETEQTRISDAGDRESVGARSKGNLEFTEGLRKA